MLRKRVSPLFPRLVFLLLHLSPNPLRAEPVANVCLLKPVTNIYCNCDQSEVNAASSLTCYIMSDIGLTPDSEVWEGFESQRNATKVTLWSRLPSRLTFVPTKALRQVAATLETLVFSASHLGSLGPLSFHNLTKVTQLSLALNGVTNLEERAISDLPALRTLELTENDISSLGSGVFVNLPELKQLYLDKNGLESVADYAFSHLKRLEELDLQNNDILVITRHTFDGLGSLRRLDIYRNQIKVLPDFAFEGAPHLRELNLKDNLLEEISSRAFEGLPRLLTLQLTNNRLKALSGPLFKGSPNLVLLDMSKNHLERMGQQVLEDLVGLRSPQFVVYLKENPWLCSCSILWMRNVSETCNSSITRTELSHVKCVVPPNSTLNLKAGDSYKVVQEFAYINQVFEKCYNYQGRGSGPAGNPDGLQEAQPSSNSVTTPSSLSLNTRHPSSSVLSPSSSPSSAPSSPPDLLDGGKNNLMPAEREVFGNSLEERLDSPPKVGKSADNRQSSAEKVGEPPGNGGASLSARDGSRRLLTIPILLTLTLIAVRHLM